MTEQRLMNMSDEPVTVYSADSEPIILLPLESIIRPEPPYAYNFKFGLPDPLMIINIQSRSDPI